MDFIIYSTVKWYSIGIVLVSVLKFLWWNSIFVMESNGSVKVFYMDLEQL